MIKAEKLEYKTVTKALHDGNFYASMGPEITELYLEGVISVGAMLSGLLVNSGVALAVLFNNNRPISDSFRILGILFAISLVLGIVIDLTPLSSFLSL